MSTNGKYERGIGDNSINYKPINQYEYRAINSMFKDIKEMAERAEQYYFEISAKLKQVVTGNAPLTKKQENWNFNVDKYNDWIMETKPNPAQNKKYLRKKYKPKKLAKHEIDELKSEIQEDLDNQWENVSSVTATVNTFEDKNGSMGFQSWVDAEKGKSND
jgi:predicted nuclease with TOPRIM domain|tara:strand:+ start:98 stop:580 length:483 start_codon:yes stop_codon:yes gene_type:complete